MTDQARPSTPRTNRDGALLCPRCEWDCTHVEHVRVAARSEDGPTNEITVDALSGAVATHQSTAAPVGRIVGEGRRQRIALLGWCEECSGSFGVVLTQHKGATLLETTTDVPDVLPDYVRHG